MRSWTKGDIQSKQREWLYRLERTLWRLGVNVRVSEYWQSSVGATQEHRVRELQRSWAVRKTSSETVLGRRAS